MRFGIQISSTYPARLDAARVCQQMSERAQMAHQTNFEAVFCPQHYLTGPDTAMMQSLPLLGYLAARLPGMYIGTSIFLLPLHNPVHVAECTATLDILSGGKLLFGVGQGYKDVEYRSFGVDKRQGRKRLTEGVEVIRRLWAGDNVTYHGECFELDGVSIAPKPLQRPGPPILVGSDTLKSVARVPEVGDHWIASRRHSKTFLREALPVYKEALARHGQEYQGLFIFRDLSIARNARDAENQIRADYEERYQKYLADGQPGERYDLSFDELKKGRLIAGSVAQVTEEVMSYHEEFGAEFMWFRLEPGMEQQAALDTIQAFGEEVIPAVKKATPSGLA